MFKKIKVFFEDPSFRNLSMLFFLGAFFIVATVFSGPFIFARGHPATPTGLRVGAVTDTTVALSWAAGSASINIGAYFLSREFRDWNDGNAFGVIRVDNPVPEDVMENLQQLPEIYSVRQLEC